VGVVEIPDNACHCDGTRVVSYDHEAEVIICEKCGGVVGCPFCVVSESTFRPAVLMWESYPCCVKHRDTAMRISEELRAFQTRLAMEGAV